MKIIFADFFYGIKFPFLNRKFAKLFQLKMYQQITQKDKNNYEFTTVSNDRYGVRTYQLANGLKVFLAQNDEAPAIETFIAVKTGSNRDPKDNTGLAHYLEHMMFKGTSKIGSANWEKEKPLLAQISNLYEAHKSEQNPEQKKEIYRQIDNLSQEAAQYAIPNEYDKLLSSIGATGTNAHTWLDETIYKNHIPKTELEKWLKIEKERFSELTLRLFHTELESVYEEFNRAQDNDGRLVNYELMDALFPTHPNGQQTTLGKAEHLKNPSMEAIHEYFNYFYVSNNMAMILVGDLDFEETILRIDEYFGKLKPVDFPQKEKIVEKPMTNIVKRTVKSPAMARVQLAWRTDSFGTREAKLAEICTNILSNAGDVGLIDINLNQKQKTLSAGAYSMAFKEYGYVSLVAIPKENQTLDEAKNLLLQQIDFIKKGDFPDWILTAIFNDMKLQRQKSWDTSKGLASTLYDNFIKNRNWQEELEEMSEIQQIKKEEVIDFAQSFFKENYAIVYKEQGENESLIRVENPKITPIQINRDENSAFFEEINQMKTAAIQPEFIDYQKEIQETEIKEHSISFVENKYNDIAQVNFIFPFGKDNDVSWSHAFMVVDYLGTSTMKGEEIKAKFYQLGVNQNFRIADTHISLMLSGLEENINQAIRLLFDYFKDLQPDDEIYENIVQTVMEARMYHKNDKNKILKSLLDYAKFGKVSKLKNIVSEETLKTTKCEVLTKKISTVFQYPYEVFYYGKNREDFKNTFQEIAEKPSLDFPKAKDFPQPQTQGKIYFVEYDMVQSEMMKVGRASEVNPYEFGFVNVFNEYFGRGLSSIVFQELRESRSLAYSAYVSYVASNYEGKHNYIQSYIGTQPDKLQQANDAIHELLTDFPLIPSQFENAKQTMLKKIATGRINRQQVFFKHYNLKKLGINHDLRKDIYQQIENLTLENLHQFYQREIKNTMYNTVLLGNKEQVFPKIPNWEKQIQTLNLEEIFGY